MNVRSELTQRQTSHTPRDNRRRNILQAAYDRFEGRRGDLNPDNNWKRRRLRQCRALAS